MARLVRKEDRGPMEVKVGNESKWICDPLTLVIPNDFFINTLICRKSPLGISTYTILVKNIIYVS